MLLTYCVISFNNHGKLWLLDLTKRNGTLRRNRILFNQILRETLLMLILERAGSCFRYKELDEDVTVHTA